MTREEYDECVSKLYTGTYLEQIQAAALLSVLPTFESKTKICEGSDLIDIAVKNKIKELDSERI